MKNQIGKIIITTKEGLGFKEKFDIDEEKKKRNSQSNKKHHMVWL
ncbi:MAG: hypothetical protein QXL18_01180 [Candidatus Woesearchaeota archaeon]